MSGESEHALAVIEGAWPDSNEPDDAPASEWSIGVVRQLCQIASDALAPTPAPEVREEWGVRYEWTNVPQGVGDRAHAERHRAHKAQVYVDDPTYREAVLVRRTVTTTPWVEVES